MKTRSWLRQLPAAHVNSLLSPAGMPPQYSSLYRGTSDLISGPPYNWRQRHIERIAKVIKQQESPMSALEYPTRNGLFMVDMQDTFCKKSADQLYVNGTEEMLHSFVPWLAEMCVAFSRVWATLDSHVLMQIFHKYRYIHQQTGEWAPENTPFVGDLGLFSDTVSESVVREYIHQLKRQGSPPLMIWNTHSLVGEKGHSLVTPIFEILALRDMVIGDQLQVRTKGLNLNSEAYGALADEVQFIDIDLNDGLGRQRVQIGTSDPELLDAVSGVDRMFIVGVAGDFCVRSTILQLYKATTAKDPSAVRKMFIISDATAFVFPDGKIPGVGKVLQSKEEIYDEYVRMGMNVVTMQQAKQLLLS